MCPSSPRAREAVTPRVKFPLLGWENSGSGVAKASLEKQSFRI